MTAGSHVEVAKPAIFSGKAGKVGGFVNACKLYIKMKMGGATVVEQVYWILSHVQRGSADIWKENVMEELEAREVEYEIAEELLTSLKKEFGGREEEAVKAAELRKLEQEERTMEEFVQKFKRAARGSRYEGRLLVEEFKQGMNRGIRKKLMEVENPPASIEQWYKRATVLDRNWRESKKEEEDNGRCSKVGAETDNAMTLSVAEKTNAFLAGDNRACSDRRSRMDKHSRSKESRARSGDSS